MKLLLSFLLVSLVLALPSVRADSLSPSATVEEITKYIQWELRVCKRDIRWKGASELAVAIVEASEQAGVDPIHVAVVIYSESSFFRDAVGKRGEHGLGQFHGKAAKDVDLTTVKGQVVGVASLIAQGLRVCGGTLLGALAYYQSGRCETGSSGPKIRIRRIIRAEKLIAEMRGVD